MRRLHGSHAVTTLVHTVVPPRERGTRWSKVSSSAGRGAPQYWQAKRSRRKTLKRVNAGRRVIGMYCFSETTLGRFTLRLGERTARSYSETTLTRSRNTAFTESCHGHSDRGSS